MIRALAMASYVYQSAAALVLIVGASHLLPPAAYTTLSLVLASAQLAGTLAFEWVQLAGVRYLSSAAPEDAPRLRVGLFLADLLSAAALAAVALAILALAHLRPEAVPAWLGADAALVPLGLGIAVGQGLTDLALTVVRVGGRLGPAAGLMLLRASLLVAGTLAGAWLDGGARGALAGALSAHALALLAVLALHRDLVRGARCTLRRDDLARFARYGLRAAGASVTHLTVPVAIRYLLVARYAADPALAAAVSLALDLLQRPFSVLVAAIHVVHYPDVVAAHDRAAPCAARAACAHLVAFIACTSAVMLGGLVAFLPEAADLLVKGDLRADFARVGAAATLFYFLHTQLQVTLAIVPHLQERAGRLVAVAAGQLAAVALLVGAGVALGAGPREALLLAASGTALVAIPAARPMLAFGARPRGGVVAAAALGAGMLAATALHADPGPLWLAARVALSAVVVAGVAVAGDFLRVRGGPATPRPPLAARLRRRAQGPRGGSARISSSRSAERSQA